MSQESPAEDALTLEELSEELADATETTTEEIDRGTEELEIAPPGEEPSSTSNPDEPDPTS